MLPSTALVAFDCLFCSTWLGILCSTMAHNLIVLSVLRLLERKFELLTELGINHCLLLVVVGICPTEQLCSHAV